MRLIIVGAGGIGSWLLPALMRLHPDTEIVVADQDRYTEGNQNRQLFNPAYVGMNKAEALVDQYKSRHVSADPRWFDPHLMELKVDDVVYGCVDNNKARVTILDGADGIGYRVISGGNEKFSAEAWYYHAHWRDSYRDPRVYSPEIMAAEPEEVLPHGCGRAETLGDTQIVSANLMATAFMAHLSMMWISDRTGMKGSDKSILLPYKLDSSLTQFRTFQPKAQDDYVITV